MEVSVLRVLGMGCEARREGDSAGCSPCHCHLQTASGDRADFDSGAERAGRGLGCNPKTSSTFSYIPSPKVLPQQLLPASWDCTP